MPQYIPICNLTQDGETGKGKIAGVDAKNPEKIHACKSLTGGQIAKATGLSRVAVKRIIRGDRRHRAKLAGLKWVRWDDGKGRSGTRYRLTEEGAKIADLLAKGLPIGKATLRALATDYLRRRGRSDALETFISDYIEKGLAALQDPRVVAILLALKPTAPKNVTTNVTTSFNPLPSYDGFKNKCSLSADGFVNSLAARLTAELGFNPIVANYCATTFSNAEILATLSFVPYRAQRGDIRNSPAFGYWWLRAGYARCAVIKQQARQRPRPTRKPPDEPDLDAIVTALREALKPFSIPVADDCAIELPNCRLRPFLDGDPATVVAKTLDLLMRHGLLPNGNGDKLADQDAPVDATDDSDFDAEPTLKATDGDPTEPTDPTDADATEADLPADPTDSDDDDGEPLPPLKCELCGRSEGEPHPALQSWQRNDFLCLSELSDGFKQHFGLPEVGLVCRGCYLMLCRTLVPPSDDAQKEADPTDEAEAMDAEVSPADQDAPANETTEPASDQNLSDGQNDPSDDGENCPSPAEPTANRDAGFAADQLPADGDDGQKCPSPKQGLGFDLEAEGDDEDEKSQRHPTQSFVWRARNWRQWEIKPFGH